MRLLIMSLILFSFPMMAYADSWSERQQVLQNNSRLEQELMQQQQNAEIQQQKNQQKADESRRQDQIRNADIERKIKNLEDRSAQPLSSGPSVIDQNLANDALAEKLDEQQKESETRSFIQRELHDSDIVFNEDTFAKHTAVMMQKGFNAAQAEVINDLYKQYILSVARDAAKGDPASQFDLGVAFIWGRPDIFSESRIEKMNSILQPGTVAPNGRTLSWEDQKKSTIDAVRLSLSKHKPLVYRALVTPAGFKKDATPHGVLPSVQIDIKKGTALLVASAKQGNADAKLLIPEILNNKENP